MRAKSLWPCAGRRRLGNGTILGAALLLVSACGSSVAVASDPQLDRRILDPRITESSGLAVHTSQPDYLWTINDSGDEPRLYAIAHDGRTAASYLVNGAEARDWEALAPGRDEAGRPVLWIGDIGDHGGAAAEIVVYRVREPALVGGDGSDQLSAQAYSLGYPDGAHNAEAMFVDPSTGRLYIVTKSTSSAGIYAGPKQLRSDVVNQLIRVADAPASITDAAFLSDGRIALRDYGSAFIYEDLGGEPLEIVLPRLEEGESIAAAPGAALLVGEETGAREIWRVPLTPASSAALE